MSTIWLLSFFALAHHDMSGSTPIETGANADYHSVTVYAQFWFDAHEEWASVRYAACFALWHDSCLL